MRAALRRRLRRIEAILLPPPPEAEVELDFSALTACELAEVAPLLQRAAEERLAGDELRRMEELSARTTVRPKQPRPPPVVEADRRSPFGPRSEEPSLAPCPGCPRCQAWSGPR